jgi:hypothetical protein
VVVDLSWFLYFLYAGVVWLCLGWPIAALVGRARRLSRLRELLGPAFSREKTYVRWSAGIAVNEQGREFAVARRRSNVAALCKAEDIVSVGLGPSPDSTQASLGGLLLSLDTKSEALPNIRINTVFASQRLSEITARLKAIQTDAKAQGAEKPSSAETPKDVSRGLEQAVLTLAQAVTALAKALNGRNLDKKT